MDAPTSTVPYVKCTWQASGGRCFRASDHHTSQHKMSAAYGARGCFVTRHSDVLTAVTQQVLIWLRSESATMYLSCWRSNGIETNRLWLNYNAAKAHPPISFTQNSSTALSRCRMCWESSRESLRVSGLLWLYSVSVSGALIKRIN
jgi:hypothetical protein